MILIKQSMSHENEEDNDDSLCANDFLQSNGGSTRKPLKIWEHHPTCFGQVMLMLFLRLKPLVLFLCVLIYAIFAIKKTGLY